MSAIIVDADAEWIRQKKQLDQVKKQTKRGTETVRLGGRGKDVKKEGGWDGRGGEFVKGVFPCLSELTVCTDCYRDERDQSLSPRQAH